MITVQSLVSDIRILSGLRGNQLFSNAQIAELASDAYASLRDIMIARFAHWFAAYYPFTLNGGNGGNTLDLTLIPDLQQDQALDQIQGDQKFTVLALGSLAERNQYGNNFGAGVGGLRYFTNGDTLEVLPPSASGGSYLLTYTPQYTVLAMPVVLPRKVTPIVRNSADNVNASLHEWTFTNGTFSPLVNIGQYLFIANDGSAHNNGAHLITDVSTAQICLTEDIVNGRWVEKQKPGAIAAKAKQRRIADPNTPAKARTGWLWQQYELTDDDYNTLLASQDYKCAICRTDKPGGNGGKYFHVDHDHVTGKVRGLLCHKCNTGIGHLNDDPARLIAAANYLESFGA